MLSNADYYYVAWFPSNLHHSSCLDTSASSIRTLLFGIMIYESSGQKTWNLSFSEGYKVNSLALVPWNTQRKTQGRVGRMDMDPLVRVPKSFTSLKSERSDWIMLSPLQKRSGNPRWGKTTPLTVIVVYSAHAASGSAHVTLCFKHLKKENMCLILLSKNI